MYTGKLGVAIFVFDRPHYFRRLLASLEENTYLHDTDFHFFRDGAVNKFSGRRIGRPASLRRNLEMARQARLPNKHFHVREENVGVGIQQFETYESMTQWYDVVLMLEDDIVVSPHYLRVMRVLFDSIVEMEDVFSASSSFVKLCAKDNVADHLDKMVRKRVQQWGEIFASSKWPCIRTPFLEYYDLIENVDFTARPHAKILELYDRHRFASGATSQDAARDMAISVVGMTRIRLVVNRALYIGAKGLYCTPAHYQKMGWAHQEPYVFPEDETIERFQLM